MSNDHPSTLRAHARLTLETVTPLHIGSGREGTLSDADVVTDVNALPAIPGSSFAGVLRSLVSADEADSIFGYSADRQTKDSKGQGSRFRVSWGHIHDCHNRPVDGVVSPDRFKDKNDPVLANARTPTLRDHVRITHRGTADTADQGKFDELCVAKGHRFTLRLELLGSPDQNASQLKAEWEKLLQRIYGAPFRLGGRTRRGFGAVKVRELHHRVFDLSRNEDLEAYLKLPVSLAEPLEEGVLEAFSPTDSTSAVPAVTSIDLRLRPRFYWLFGGDDTGETTADMATVRETWIKWENGVGSTKNGFLLPGSAIKGAISHRTAFHHNCLAEHWVENGKATAGNENPAVRDLFGFVEKEETAEEVARRGRILIDDLFLPEESAKTQRLSHVKIDRFTGGAWPGALFDEEPLFGGPAGGVPIQIQILGKELDPKSLASLDRALRDLCTGFLPLGGGAGRGHGRFELAGAPAIKGPLAQSFTEINKLCTSTQKPAAT